MIVCRCESFTYPHFLEDFGKFLAIFDAFLHHVKRKFLIEENMIVDKALPPEGMTIKQLLWLCGGKDKVSQECGISRLQWTTVPDKHVGTVASMSGLSVERVRPDLAAVAHLYHAKKEQAA
jgi:hypothetical protein